MKPAEYWIDHLKLLPHPEGGFYRETYRSPESIPTVGLHDRFTGPRSMSTAIYFLLRSQDRSLFHRIKSDELWHFHAGSTLDIFVLDAHGLTKHTLGSDLEKGESLQVIVPAGKWFGAMLRSDTGYMLAGCTVSPGFDFADFEMANRAALLQQYPSCTEIINLLTV